MGRGGARRRVRPGRTRRRERGCGDGAEAGGNPVQPGPDRDHQRAGEARETALLGDATWQQGNGGGEGVGWGDGQGGGHGGGADGKAGGLRSGEGGGEGLPRARPVRATGRGWGLEKGSLTTALRPSMLFIGLSRRSGTCLPFV